MIPIVINVPEEEAERLNKRAQETGYESIEAYLRALAEQDMNQAEDVEELLKDYMTNGKVDADKIRAALTPLQLEIVEGVKQGLRDARSGKAYTMEEFRRIMAEDDD